MDGTVGPRLLAVGLVLLAASVSGYAQEKPITAVVPFQALGVSAAEAHGLAVLFEAALQETGRFTVIEQMRMESVLEAQETSLADCTDEACAVEIGKLLAAEQIVLGTAGKIGQRYYLAVKLIDVAKGTNLATENEQKPSLDEIVDTLVGLAERLAGLNDAQAPKATVATSPSPASVAAPKPTNSLVEMVLVVGGTFQMGDTFGDGEANEKPVHGVTLSSYWIGKFEVTVAQFRAFVQEAGYKTTAEREGGGYFWAGSKWEKKADANWKNPDFSQTDRDPVVFVSWLDAVEYCNWLSGKEGLAPFYSVSGSSVSANWNASGYRLPTESEWEYAARSRGKAYKYSWDNGSPDGNIADETAKKTFPSWAVWTGYTDGYTYTAPVGSFRPNELGLYDMAGNAWEWCNDWFGSYTADLQTDPRGPAAGSYRVSRGGSWGSVAVYARVVADRYFNTPDISSSYLGFRPVRTQ